MNNSLSQAYQSPDQSPAWSSQSNPPRQVAGQGPRRGRTAQGHEHQRIEAVIASAQLSAGLEQRMGDSRLPQGPFLFYSELKQGIKSDTWWSETVLQRCAEEKHDERRCPSSLMGRAGTRQLESCGEKPSRKTIENERLLEYKRAHDRRHHLPNHW